MPALREAAPAITAAADRSKLLGFLFDFVGAPFRGGGGRVRPLLNCLLGFMRARGHGFLGAIGGIFGCVFGVMTGIFQILARGLRRGTERQTEGDHGGRDDCMDSHDLFGCNARATLGDIHSAAGLILVTSLSPWFATHILLPSKAAPLGLFPTV